MVQGSLSYKKNISFVRGLDLIDHHQSKSSIIFAPKSMKVSETKAKIKIDDQRSMLIQGKGGEGEGRARSP